MPGLPSVCIQPAQPRAGARGPAWVSRRAGPSRPPRRPAASTPPPGRQAQPSALPPRPPSRRPRGARTHKHKHTRTRTRAGPRPPPRPAAPRSRDRPPAGSLSRVRGALAASAGPSPGEESGTRGSRARGGRAVGECLAAPAPRVSDWARRSPPSSPPSPRSPPSPAPSPLPGGRSSPRPPPPLLSHFSWEPRAALLLASWPRAAASRLHARGPGFGVFGFYSQLRGGGGAPDTRWAGGGRGGGGRKKPGAEARAGGGRLATFSPPASAQGKREPSPARGRGEGGRRRRAPRLGSPGTPGGLGGRPAGCPPRGGAASRGGGAAGARPRPELPLARGWWGCPGGKRAGGRCGGRCWGRCGGGGLGCGWGCWRLSSHRGLGGWC